MTLKIVINAKRKQNIDEMQTLSTTLYSKSNNLLVQQEKNKK